MSAKVETRLSDSSQQTQINGHVLGGSEFDAPWKHHNGDQTQDYTPLQFSEQTPQSEPVAAPPGLRYNFPGLTGSETQTQTQGLDLVSSKERDDDLDNSQKENEPTGTDESQPVISRSPPPSGSQSGQFSPVQDAKSSLALNRPSSSVAPVKIINKPDAPPLPLNDIMPPPTKASTKPPSLSTMKKKMHAPPQPKTPPPRITSNTRRDRRSSPPASPDSFAGSPPFPDKLYERENPMFQMPVSQIFEDDDDEDQGEEEKTRDQRHGVFGSQASSVAVLHTLTDSRSPSLSPPKTSTPNRPRKGHFNPFDPSSDDESQEYAQPFKPPPPPPAPVKPTASQLSTPPLRPTQEGSSQDEIPSFEATQLASTQPVSESDLVMDHDPRGRPQVDFIVHDSGNTPSTTADTTTTTNTHPRSLASVVNRDKQWRAKAYLNTAPRVAPQRNPPPPPPPPYNPTPDSINSSNSTSVVPNTSDGSTQIVPNSTGGDTQAEAQTQPVDDGSTQVISESSNGSKKQTKSQEQEALFESIMRSRQETTPASSAGVRGPPVPPHVTQESSMEVDVVPDSEPARAMVTSSAVQSESTGDTSVPDSEAQFGEVVQDSSRDKRGEQEEEDEDSDDDDDEGEGTPLAITIQRKTSASSAKSKSATKPPASTVPFPSTKPSATPLVDAAAAKKKGTKAKNTNVPSASTSRSTRSRSAKSVPRTESSEVPSSVPLQDRPPKLETTDSRNKGKQRASNDDPSRTGYHNFTALAEDTDSPLTEEENEQEEANVSHESQDPLDLLSTKQEDESTEPASDVQMSESETKKASASAPRKRKRTASSNVSKPTVSRSSTRVKEPTATPTARSNKRLKGNNSTVRSIGASSGEATRVFALWVDDGNYYLGTVHSHQDGSTTKFKIHFDDDTDTVVDVSHIARAEPRLGDEVLLLNVDAGDKGKISRMDRLASHGVVTVEIDHGDELSYEEVKLRDCTIAALTFKRQWKDRLVLPNEIVTIVQPKNRRNASMSSTKMSIRSQTPSVPRPLARTGIVLTGAEKDQYVRRIKTMGGVHLDEWHLTVFPVDFKHETQNRWVAKKSDFQVKPTKNVDKVFLLSDKANQKPKYLIALALGIPCVSFDWLDALEVNPQEDWTRYLLPAGFSDELRARPSQKVDFNWGTSKEHLTEIASNPLTFRLFEDKSVLVVGHDFFPPALSKNRRASTASLDRSTELVPHIILCMGATSVEAVPELKYASKPNLASFDYIVVDQVTEKDLPEATMDKFVPFQWVKDCLISGRAHPRESAT